MKKPDFIAIGPTKTGTTWIHENLSKHPDVWLHPVKEINFFWGGGRRVPKDRRYIRRLFRLLFGITDTPWRIKKINLCLRHCWHTKTMTGLGTILFYSCMPRSVFWYKSLFWKHRDKVCGDISPRYAFRLAESEILKIHRHNPNIKIIISLRNPIDRVWSEVRMKELFLKKGHQINSELFLKSSQLHKKKQVYYDQVLKMWVKVFGWANIKVVYFEQLESSPSDYLKEICDFIGVDFEAGGFAKPDLSKKVFKGIDMEMPPVIRKMLIDRFHESIAELDRYLPSQYSKSWLQYCEQHLSD